MQLKALPSKLSSSVLLNLLQVGVRRMAELQQTVW